MTAAAPVGRTQVNRAIADIPLELLEDPRVLAAGHVICAMGGHIPHQDVEAPGSCTHHRRQAALALTTAGVVLVGVDEDLESFAQRYKAGTVALQEHLHDRIRKERGARVSYVAIGNAFGVSRQAAWERFHNLEQEPTQ